MDRIQNYICLSGPPAIRVAILRDVPNVTVSVNGPFKIVEVPSERVVQSGSYLPATRISPSGSGFKIDSKTAGKRILRIIAAESGGVTLKEVQYRTERAKQISYRGEIELRSKGAKMDVLNVVDLETYLAGVLGSEAPLHWPDAALRAQAIASRSYALYQIKTRKMYDYDVKATIGDQKYLGMKAELPRSRRLCDDTRGIVLFFDNHLFPTYFHSTCGGHTEQVDYLLESRSIQPLTGVACPYCQESKYAKEWSVRLTADEIRAKLRKKGVRVGTVYAIEPYDTGAGGRHKMLKIRHSDGTTDMRAYRFRLAMVSMKLRNTNFRVTKLGNVFEFRGTGYGHGIGMCQFGAMGQAKLGRSAVDILEYYYPGAELVRIYGP